MIMGNIMRSRLPEPAKERSLEEDLGLHQVRDISLSADQWKLAVSEQLVHGASS